MSVTEPMLTMPLLTASVVFAYAQQVPGSDSAHVLSNGCSRSLYLIEIVVRPPCWIVPAVNSIDALISNALACVSEFDPLDRRSGP